MYSADKVWVDDELIVVRLDDGRIIGCPKVWFPKIMAASSDQLDSYKLSPYGVHWPELDEDISFRGLMSGRHYCHDI